MSRRSSYKNTIAIVFLGAMSFILNSCFTDDPAFTRDNIDGYWIAEMFDGELVDVAQTEVFEFSGTVLNRHRFMPLSPTDTKWSSDGLRFSVTCCNVEISGEITGIQGVYEERLSYNMTWDVMRHTDSLLVYRVTDYLIDGIETDFPYDILRLRRVSLSNGEIVGIWQLEKKNGTEASDFRIEFNSDYTYKFYTHERGEWLEIEENEGEYARYDNFLSLTQFANLYLSNSLGWSALGFNLNIVAEESEEEEKVVLELTSDNLTLRFNYISSEEEDS